MTSAIQKPEWIKYIYNISPYYLELKKSLKEKALPTICQESLCPNMAECWSKNTATFLLMGDACTRNCRFCHVRTAKLPSPIDPNEPTKLLSSIREMKLDYVVLTSVDRDDLPD